MTAVKRVHVDDVEWLLECHPTATMAELAPRFGVTPSGLQKALRNEDRRDLLDLLARNAALAGHSVSRAAS